MAQLNYQNPPVPTGVLDSEVVGIDPITGLEIRHEFVVPVESISGAGPDTELKTVMLLCLIELKKIRVLLEQDVVPGLSEDDADELLTAEGHEDNQDAEGIEEE